MGIVLTLFAIVSLTLSAPRCAAPDAVPSATGSSGSSRGCRTEELDAAMERVTSRSWTRRKRVPFSVYVDERRCRVVLNIVRITPAERQRLRAIDPRIVVELVSGPIERIDRPRR